MRGTAEAGRGCVRSALAVLSGVLISLLFFSGCSEPLTGTSYVRKAPAVSAADQVADGETFSSPSSPRISWGIDRYSPIVKRYAQQYHMDWVLVLSVMEHESKFNHDAVSYRGAYGLMQLMPVTQMELTEKLGIRETVTPRNNIRAGVYHLRQLYDLFSAASRDDRLRLTLAAYNAGIGRIQDAQRIAGYLGSDPNSWAAVRDALPLLSRSYYTLHRRIWDDGRPVSGYFRDWRQTVDYVHDVLNNYQEFNVALR